MNLKECSVVDLLDLACALQSCRFNIISMVKYSLILCCDIIRCVVIELDCYIVTLYPTALMYTFAKVSLSCLTMCN